jgi:hypothetical protein
MTTLSALLLVLTSLCAGAAFASLIDSFISKRGGGKSQRRSSIRLTLFFLFSSCIIVTATCLVVFTPFLDEYASYSVSDYVYVLFFFFMGFFSALWYKTFFPLAVSLYVLLFLSFSYYIDQTCLSYSSPVMVTFEKNLVREGDRSIPLIHSDASGQDNLLKTGYLVVQEFKIPAKLLLPLQRNYYRLVVFSQDRIVQDDFGAGFFSPVQDPGQNPFFYAVASILDPIYTLLLEENSDGKPVFYFIEINLAEFYPYVFTLQPVKSGQGFSYILDKLL